jgi:hypothetical protein
MKLFLLSREANDYDEYDSFVVRAESETQARQIAAASHGFEDESEWLEGGKSRCDELTPEGAPGVVIGSYNAG